MAVFFRKLASSAKIAERVAAMPAVEHPENVLPSNPGFFALERMRSKVSANTRKQLKG